jgi:hypothetical protein
MTSTKRVRASDGDFTRPERTKDVKLYLGMMFAHADEDERCNLRNLLKKYKDELPLRTEQRWIEKYKKYGSSHKITVESGRARKIEQFDEFVICGYVISHIDDGKLINNLNVHKFMQEKLSIECSITTVYRVTSRLGFRSRKLLKTRDGYTLSYEISAKDYRSFVKDVVHPIFKDHAKSDIISIDFTYTSHKKDGRKVLGLAGG